jgi:osmotically-inducible protein OsmY
MKIALLIAAALALAACERPAAPLTMAAPGSTPREDPTTRQQKAAAAPVAPAPTPSPLPPPEALTDGAITEKIAREIASDPRMAGADVSINIDRGVVVLAGTVKSHEQTGIASAHAQSQDGVLRVDNHLRPVLS